MSKTPKFFINAFYESKFKDNLFVIKAGGKIIEEQKALDNLISNIHDLNKHGIKVLLVYGGGRRMDEAAEARGLKIKKEGGRRITDAADLAMIKEVIGGTLSLEVYQSMARHYAEGLSFNAVPQDWMKVKLRPKTPVDYGFVGDVVTTYSRPINRLFRSVNFMAVPCLAWAEDGGTLVNINADTIATQIAIAIKAQKLIFLSDVDGVLIDGKTADIITGEEIPALIKNGTATGGMKVKLENCLAALDSGVRRIHLISGLRDDALKREIYEPVGPGTMLFREAERESYENEVEALKVIEAHK